MRKIALAFITVLAACAPAYQAPTVALAPAYGVADRRPITRPPADTCRADSNPAASTTSVHFSPALSTAPFWRTLDDSVLSTLIEEALRANTDVRIAEARLTGTRVSRRLA